MPYPARAEGLVNMYPAVEMQSVYSVASADRAFKSLYESFDFLRNEFKKVPYFLFSMIFIGM